MKQIKSALPLVFLCPFLFLFSSCIGINADIALNQNGSGTIALEYRVSKSLDSLGKLDGNERWNTVPVGKADFERTLDRLPEIRLLSFTSREDEKDLIISAKMEFKSIQGLLSFLDASGGRSAFSKDARGNRMRLTLNEGGWDNNNAGLAELLAAVSDSYAVKMSVSFPAEGSIAVSDGQDNPLETIPGGEIKAGGKNVSFSFPLYEVLTSPKGINVEFSW